MANTLLDEFVVWVASQPLYHDLLTAFDRIANALGSERTLTVAVYQAVCGAALWLTLMSQHGFNYLAELFRTVSRRFPMMF